ncbi:uncharacterized protein [Amphiura filiformis]|uniref:uncharacterized protein n=1 Tax=Amphiura filiformis TaxID=82378 RepID=UPI003B21CF25
MAQAKEDYSKKLCSKCEKTDNQAIVYCKDCKHYLCQPCYEAHTAWEVMKHHRIATTEDLISGKATLSDVNEAYEIMSQCNSVQEASKVELDKVDETLANVQTPESTWILGHNWKQIGLIKVPCRNTPSGIAVTSDGMVAVCDFTYRILVLSKSGDLMHTIDDGARLGGSGDVSITSTNGYVIPKAKQCCRFYDCNYKLLSELKTYGANNIPSIARAVTVDKNGCIILGMDDDAISIHNADGSFKSSFAILYTPWSVAVTSHEEIVVTGYINHTLQLFNYSGKYLLTFDPSPEVNTWYPTYLCCSKNNEVFVSNWGDPKAIYRYAASGVYMGCVTTDVSDPRGIALSHDDQELYVAEWSDKVVKIFKRP